MNKQDLLKFAEQAQAALSKAENKKEYPASYVVSRFIKAADKNLHDNLIRAASDVFQKKAKNQKFFTNYEIASVYDNLYGLSGRTSAFKSELGDLLPADHNKIEKKAYTTTRRQDNKTLGSTADKEVVSTLAGIFDNGYRSSAGVADEAKKVVLSHLNSLGMMPDDVVVKKDKSNKHFILSSAFYRTASGNQHVSVHIPVPIVDGRVRAPNSMISDGSVGKLSRANLMTHLKVSEIEKKNLVNNKYAGQHSSTKIGNLNAKLPDDLTKYANFTEILSSSKDFTPSQIRGAANMIDVELKGAGVLPKTIKVAESDSTAIIFDVTLHTQSGPSLISVPVEFHHDKAILPSRFASKRSGRDEVFDFNTNTLRQFVETAKRTDVSSKLARASGDMMRMNYNQLINEIDNAVASGSYNSAQDALEIIHDRFGPNNHKKALEHFTELLKAASFSDSKRAAVIKKAFKQGYLVNTTSSLEPFCPQLGQPLSKIYFDESGRPQLKTRKKLNDIRESSAFRASKIIFR